MSRTIVVTPHAVAGLARRKYRGPELEAFEEADWNLDKLKRMVGALEADRLLQIYDALDAEIREIVRCGIASGKVLDRRPKGFVLYGRRNSMSIGQRFVHCGNDPDVGFIIKRHTEGEDVVVTTLHRVGVNR